MATANLSAHRLRDLLHYDPETGLFTWRVQRCNVAKGASAGWVKKGGYIGIGVDGRLHSAHRLAWLYVYGEMPTGDIDHINGITSDNRIDNLRNVARQINIQNQRRPQKGSISGYLGVFYDKRRNKYVARIKPKGGGRKHIGEFATAEEAHSAYVQAKRVAHEGCTI